MKRESILDEGNLAHRHAKLKGVGYTTEQIQKPLIGVLNCWGEINPAAIHMDRLTQMVKAGIESAGGTPMEFAISSLCPGMGIGGRGSSYSLAYRDIVADFVEIIAEENFFDGIVFTTVCDDVIPAHLMAAARLNLPSIMLLGGYMLPKVYKGKTCYSQQVTERYAQMQKGLLGKNEFEKFVDVACGNCGACPIMGTGHTMGAIAETLGMTLPGNSTVCGADSILGRLAYQTGVQAVDLWRRKVKPGDILTEKSFENAIRVFLALGGSTNALIHLPAIAAELEIEIPFSRVDSLSRETPFLCNVKPSGRYTMKEFDEAGGLPALLNELAPLLHSEMMTVTGKSLGENVRGSEIFDPEVIFPLSAPIAREGGIAILRGSLAPNGAVVKISGLNQEDMAKRGPARVYNSEKEACEALLNSKIGPGDMVIIRYLGPKGYPGMRIAAYFLWLLAGMKLDKTVTVITDGRFSGTNLGGAVGHVSPEAADGGPIALVRDGDIIEIDIPKREAELCVSEDELKKRSASWEPMQAKFNKGLLARVSKTMLPIEKGAVLQRKF
jgi:dihydroxy-acid dehydratase